MFCKIAQMKSTNYDTFHHFEIMICNMVELEDGCINGRIVFFKIKKISVV